MDWSERHLCIKCDKGGNVLLCNEIGCPLAVHERCLGGPARLDDAGRFYCPYCVYKQAVAETRKAREFSLAKKKALLIFMDGSEKDMRENKTCEENGRDQSNVNNGLCEDGKSEKAMRESETCEESGRDQLNVNNGLCEDGKSENGMRESKTCEENGRNQSNVNNASCEDGKSEKGMRESKTCEENGRNQSNVNNGLCEDGKSKANNDGVIDQPREEEKVEEDSESSGGSKDEDRSLDLNRGNGDIAVGEKQIREEECEEENAEEEEREASDEEENAQGKDFGTSLSSTNEDSTLTGRARATRVPKRITLVDKESNAISVLQSKFSDKKKHASPTSTPAKKSARSPSSAMGKRKVVIKLSSARRLSKSEIQSKKSDTPGSRKRSRLMWTEEEEEALRE
ncbi:myb-like protein V isoform X2 [Salvia hispanica]|nr:myb-like protein V isoform X2 [Salvia hispanica]